MIKFFVINKVQGTVREFADPLSVAAHMLGRLTTDFVIVKCDDDGDRIVPMVSECGQLQTNCIYA